MLVLLHILAARAASSVAAFEVVVIAEPVCCSMELAEVVSVVFGFVSILLSFVVAKGSNSGVVRSDGWNFFGFFCS